MAFIDFLGANLNGQTNIRVDTNWASQAEVLQGFTNVAPLDFVLRDDELRDSFTTLSWVVWYMESPSFDWEGPDAPYALSEVYDEEVEARVAQVYQRDYVQFGFGPWRQD